MSKIHTEAWLGGTGLGYSGSELVKEGGGGGGCRHPEALPFPTSPAVQSAPSFHFGNGFYLVGAGWGWPPKATRPPSFSGFPEGAIVREECSAGSPEGGGASLRAPDKPALCSQLRAPPGWPSQYLSGLPGRVAKGGSYWKMPGPWERHWALKRVWEGCLEEM